MGYTIAVVAVVLIAVMVWREWKIRQYIIGIAECHKDILVAERNHFITECQILWDRIEAVKEAAWVTDREQILSRLTTLEQKALTPAKERDKPKVQRPGSWLKTVSAIDTANEEVGAAEQ